MTTPAVLPDTLDEGRCEPLGSCVRDGGVNIAVFSENAWRIECCVFDAQGRRELRRYPLHGPHGGIFHGFLPGAGAGLVYGLRAWGPDAPFQGHRFDPNLLLLDPCAREVIGPWRDALSPARLAARPPTAHATDAADDAPDDAPDDAALALKARVCAPPVRADTERRAARVPTRELVLYEVHVKAFSQGLPGVPEALRGTYAGLAHPASIAHLRTLGVTTLSLLPVQQHLDETALLARGLVNHWGYNTIAFFAADPRLAQASHRDDPAAVNAEFRAMVQALHAAGLEVVLDVVYNHTAESDESGATLSWRGLDNASWYRLRQDDPARYDNHSGCGNTLNLAHPQVLRFVMDSLRHWVEVMGVDGFRFDLATILGRRRDGSFDPEAAFLAALQQDPLLAQVHLIAEPWDATMDGYQVGRFPGRFLEWNDRFRDAMRLYWLQRGVRRGEFARRFTASADLFHHGQRRPSACINFVTAHDGFTLADVVRYSRKHNDANGEGGRDGRDHEPCDNLGVEGPSDDPTVQMLRQRVQRALLATLVLAQGTPMLCGGDEIGRTQQGNNNAYCHDSPLTWYDWAQADAALAAFVAQVLALRRAEPLLHHDDWFEPAGEAAAPVPGRATLAWFAPSGQPMQLADWHDPQVHALACLLQADPAAPARGSAALWLAFNPEILPSRFHPPPGDWVVALDSSGESPAGRPVAPTLWVPARAVLVLRPVSAEVCA